MMIMSGSQPMTHVLCQVMPCLHLEGNYEHKDREIFSTKDVPHPFMEYVSNDEDINQMEEIITDWDVE